MSQPFMPCSNGLRGQLLPRSVLRPLGFLPDDVNKGLWNVRRLLLRRFDPDLRGIDFFESVQHPEVEIPRCCGIKAAFVVREPTYSVFERPFPTVCGGTIERG